MKRFWFRFWLVVMVAALAYGCAAAQPTFTVAPKESKTTLTPERAAARAQELLRLARAAIGGDAALQAVQTLSTGGKYRRQVKYISVQSPTKVMEKEKTLDGKIELDFALPDRFRRRATEETLRGYRFEYAQVINGDEAWRDPPLRAISSNKDSRVIDVSDFQRTELMSAQGARQQLTIYALGWLLRPLPSFPLKLTYEGVFDLGSGLTDVISADASGGFRMALLLDAKTHVPVGVGVASYYAAQMPVLSDAAGFFDRRFMQETFARVRRERQERTRPAKNHEVIFRFFDHRAVSGVLLPHRITISIDGEPFEEATFDGIEINRSINPKNSSRQNRKIDLVVMEPRACCGPVGELARWLGIEIIQESWRTADDRVLYLAECRIDPPRITLNTHALALLAAREGTDSNLLTQRAIAHELYHILTRQPSCSGDQVEEAAHRFAAIVVGDW